MEPVNANTLIQGLGKLFKETFPKHIELRLDLDDKLPRIIADSSQINQVVLNLCVNGRDAMPEGGTLTIKTEAVDRKDLQHNDNLEAEQYVCIEVADTGVGMDENLQSRIFEPFFTTKGIDEGTGLGLAVVYGIVKNHNGLILMAAQFGIFDVCFSD